MMPLERLPGVAIMEISEESPQASTAYSYTTLGYTKDFRFHSTISSSSMYIDAILTEFRKWK